MKSIIKRMVRIYRMWRFVRLVEKKFKTLEFLNDEAKAGSPYKPMTVASCIYEFGKKKSIFGRRYSSHATMTAFVMAHKFGYIGNDLDTEKIEEITEETGIAISGEGLRLTSFVGLMDEMAKSVGSISPLLISLIALAVSIYSLLKLD